MFTLVARSCVIYVSRDNQPISSLQVSWIRRRDSHILTIDWLLFIADDRFRIFLVEPTCTWTLQIKYVQPRDAGIYECQINTSPKMSHLVQLNVVGKCLYILFPPPLPPNNYYNDGLIINTCLTYLT